LKKIIHVAIVVILSILVYTAASYANTFPTVVADCFTKLIIAFLWGIVLRKYFNTTLFFYTSIIIMAALTVFVLYPLDKRSINVLLPTYSVFLSGYFLGYYWSGIKLPAKALFLCLIIGFIIVDKYIIYPRYYFSYMNLHNSVLIGQHVTKFLQNVHLQNQSTYIDNPFEKNKVYLVEFYFNNCPPCKKKEKDLKKINNLGIENFEIVWVDNGALDSLSEFMKADFKDNQNHFYDNAGQFARNLNIRSFPFEIMVDQSGNIRHVFDGYASDLQTSYINETVKKIKTLLHE
jgi:hypothetical protein